MWLAGTARRGELFSPERAPLPPTLGRATLTLVPHPTHTHSPALDVEIADAAPPSNFFATEGALSKKSDR